MDFEQKSENQTRANPSEWGDGQTVLWTRCAAYQPVGAARGAKTAAAFRMAPLREEEAAAAGGGEAAAASMASVAGAAWTGAGTRARALCGVPRIA